MNPLSPSDIALIRGYAKRNEQTSDKSVFLDSVGRVVNDHDETILTLRDVKPQFESEEEGEPEPEQEQ